MDRFNISLRSASQYPKNLVTHNVHPHQLDEYYAQLEAREDDLFLTNEEDSKVNVLEWDYGLEPNSRCIQNAHQLDGSMGFAVDHERHDPAMRCVFISARSSRDKLWVSREVLIHILTYHQVMPAFLDFVFAFGKSETPQDFHFMGLRSQLSTNLSRQHLAISQLGRSARSFQLCYNAKTVEFSKTVSSTWPWSIRQCALHQIYDLETHRTSWMFIKANKVIQKRVETFIYQQDHLDPTQTFPISLAIHSLICEWSTEGWRWYIDFLDKQLQRTTKKVTFGPLPAYSPESKSNSKTSPWTEKPITSQQPNSPLEADHNVPACPFELLRDVYYIEEKANEVLLVLRSNCSVMRDLADHFHDLRRVLEGKSGLKIDLYLIQEFQTKTSTARKDVELQAARTEMLLKMLSARKALLEGTLQYDHARMNQYMAEKAQASAETAKEMTEKAHASAVSMEEMTEKMHVLADKTHFETISMRLLSVVALLYLPGDLVASLMSTQIITFRPIDLSGSRSKRAVNVSALVTFLEAALPLLLLTFAIGYGLHFQRAHRQGRTLASLARKWRSGCC